MTSGEAFLITTLGIDHLSYILAGVLPVVLPPPMLPQPPRRPRHHHAPVSRESCFHAYM
jgi:hypothetical protein